MHILYDHQIFYRQNYGGVSRYFCELMNRFSVDPEISFTLPLHYVQNDNLEQFPHLNQYWSGRYHFLYNTHLISTIGKKMRYNAINFSLNYIVNNRGESVRLLKKQDFDIFHPTYYEPYFLPYLQKKPFVLTVYDMIHEIFPMYFKTRDKTKERKKILIEHAEAVIAISENTKRDILKFTDVDPDRVHVVHLGNPFEYMEGSPQINMHSQSLVFGKPYILFVGGREAYKNFDFFIASIAGFLRKYEDLHVICAGSLPFSPRERTMLENLNVLNKVHHIKINDLLLKKLYANALAFVFPSIYEGFGLPVLEAFSCGCPVILSNSSSLPEVGGDAAIYFELGNSESLRSAVEQVICDNSLRRSLIKKGSERVKLFSWKKTARCTKTIYEKCLL